MRENLEGVRVFIRPGFTDMRKHINGLSAIVQEEMGEDALDGSLYLFLGSCRKRLKVLYWDDNGFCLWYKRLESDRFPWPKEAGEKIEIDGELLSMLLSGIDFFKAHKKLYFKKAV